MLRRNEIVLGFLCGVAVCAVLIVLNSDTSAIHQICETNRYNGKESCNAHHLPYVVAWYVGYWADKSANVFIAVATGLVAVFTRTLYVVTRDQLRHNRLVERAQVFPLHPESEYLAQQNGTVWGLRLRIPWKNSGATPAFPVNSFIGATWVQNANNFQFGAPPPQGQHQPFVLGPSAEIPSGTIDITHGPLNDLLIHQTGAQFFWGWARYRDTFDDRTTHVVEFCFRVRAEGQLGVTGTPLPRIVFSFDGPHNRCYDEPAA